MSSPNTMQSLLYEHRDGLIEFARMYMSSDLKLTFATQFLNSFNDESEAFPIMWDRAMEWLGFNVKKTFKTFVTKTLNTDEYVIFRDRGDHKNETRGGHNNEVIRLSTNGYMKLEATVHKQAVNSFFTDVSNMCMAYVMRKRDEDAQEAKRRVQSMQFALETERQNLERFMQRRVRADQPGEYVYIYQQIGAKDSGDSSDKRQVIKIGETNDPTRREHEHRAASTNSCVVYTKRCCNRKILEKVVHHVLDQYRINPKREWFHVSVDTAKAVIDSCQMFIDGLVDRCEDYEHSSLYKNLTGLVNALPNASRQKTTQPNETAEDAIPQPPPPKPQPPTTVDLPPTINNPLDFDKFMQECCVLDATQTSFSTDIFGAHRLWGRCCLKTTHDALYKYLCANFKRRKIYDPITQAQLASFAGFSLKPFIYPRDDPPSDVDQFIEERCNINYSARAPLKEICAAFESWRKDTMDKDYAMTPSERKRLDEALGNKFLIARVFDGNSSVQGYFGLDLKGGQTAHVGKKLAHKLKKQVYEVDIRTQQIVRTFESLTAAARHHNRHLSEMSTAIRFAKPYNEHVFRYAPKT